MQVQLVMFKSDGTRREFTLRKDITVIGRAVECDFQIPLAAVSRSHCEITVREDHISVRDMGSSNGTFVNGSRVQQSDLEPGDKLVIGPVTFTIVVDGHPMDVDAVRSAPAPAAPFELEEGTVDVEAQTEARTQSNVKIPAKTPQAAKPAVNELEELNEPEIDMTFADEPKELHDDAGGENPLAALQAMTRPKKDA